jgi:hypothetical protein
MSIQIILEAKDNALNILKDQLSSHIYNGLLSLYNTSKNINPKAPIKTFQDSLQRIPVLSSGAIKLDYDYLTKNPKSKFSEDLFKSNLETIFICYAKLELDNFEKELQVKDLDIPNNISFLHQCYINSARNLFQKADLFYVKDLDKSENKDQIIEIIKNSIDKTIKDAVPYKELLKKYVNKNTNKEPKNKQIKKPIEPKSTDNEEINNLDNILNFNTKLINYDPDFEVSSDINPANLDKLQKSLLSIEKNNETSLITLTEINSNITSIKSKSKSNDKTLSSSESNDKKLSPSESNDKKLSPSESVVKQNTVIDINNNEKSTIIYKVPNNFDNNANDNDNDNVIESEKDKNTNELVTLNDDLVTLTDNVDIKSILLSNFDVESSFSKFNNKYNL